MIKNKKGVNLVELHQERKKTGAEKTTPSTLSLALIVV